MGRLNNVIGQCLDRQCRVSLAAVIDQHIRAEWVGYAPGTDAVIPACQSDCALRRRKGKECLGCCETPRRTLDLPKSHENAAVARRCAIRIEPVVPPLRFDSTYMVRIYSGARRSAL